MLLKFELKKLDWQVHYFFRGGWLGGVEEWRIKPSHLSTKLKLKFKLSLAIKCEMRGKGMPNYGTWCLLVFQKFEIHSK